MTNKATINMAITETTTSWDGGAIIVDRPHTRLVGPERYKKLACRSFFLSVYGEIVRPTTCKMLAYESFERSVIFNDLKISEGCEVEYSAFIFTRANHLIIGKGVKLSKGSFYGCEFNEIIFEDENDIVEGAFEKCWCSHDVPQNPMIQVSDCDIAPWIARRYPHLIP